MSRYEHIIYHISTSFSQLSSDDMLKSSYIKSNLYVSKSFIFIILIYSKSDFLSCELLISS